MTSLLAEIPYPRIPPVLFELGPLKPRWYGLMYIAAFTLAYLVLRRTSKRGRWPVAYERVADVLFWGVLGVFLGGRLGYVFFYMIPFGEFSWSQVYKVWDGGMSFHGGLLGVVAAYGIYSWRTRAPLGDLCDGLALATPLGLGCVRLGNFNNAELYGTVTDVPWAMRFPDYERAGGPERWAEVGKPMLPDLRHPSQLYEAFAEGLLLFVCLRWLASRGIGGGRLAAAFLILYGTFRFVIEYVRQPDSKFGSDYVLGMFTQGQRLCFFMVLGGLGVWALCSWRDSYARRYDPETGAALGPLATTKARDEA